MCNEHSVTSLRFITLFRKKNALKQINYNGTYAVKRRTDATCLGYGNQQPKWSFSIVKSIHGLLDDFIDCWELVYTGFWDSLKLDEEIPYCICVNQRHNSKSLGIKLQFLAGSKIAIPSETGKETITPLHKYSMRLKIKQSPTVQKLYDCHSNLSTTQLEKWTSAIPSIIWRTPFTSWPQKIDLNKRNYSKLSC